MKKKLILFTTSIAVLFCGASIIYGEDNVAMGSKDDPIVTLKYVESRIEQVKYYIDQNLEIFKQENEELKKSIENSSTTPTTDSNESVQAPGVFKVIQVAAGQKLICGESAEIIWRSGKASAIGSENGGLTDVTIGKNLATGDEVVSNHLIIIPRDDGRGMNVEVDSYLMIKGSYRIE